MVKDTTTITLDGRKLGILLSWIYSDIKPTDWHKVDKVLVRQLKNACLRLSCDDLIDDFQIGVPTNQLKKYDEFGNEENEEDKEHLQQRKLSITDTYGIFFCPKCNLRTNEKTYETKCVICNTSLNRG